MMCAASFGVDLLGRTSLREGRTPVVPRTDWKKRSRLKKKQWKIQNSQKQQELTGAKVQWQRRDVAKRQPDSFVFCNAR